jgi:spore coat protein U-like protein
MNVRRLAFSMLALLASLLFVPSARATITCTTIGSPGVSINYVSGTTVSLQSFFTVTCTRSSTNDATSLSYSVTTANNGTNPNGINNRATNTASGAVLRYDFFTTSGCGTQWKGNVAINDAITWAPNTTGTITRQTTFWTCINTAQTPTASGLYSDTVGLTMAYGSNQTLSGSAQVSIYAPALCTVTSAPNPGTITLNYAAFGPQKSGSSSFSVQCTIQMPYTLATDVTENVLSGVRYRLALSATSANGTGAPQAFTVTATAGGGQAGSCPTAACTQSYTHTLTISY